jgi:hypothetical protein
MEKTNVIPFIPSRPFLTCHTQFLPFSACNRLPSLSALVSCGRRPCKVDLLDRNLELWPTPGTNVFDPISPPQTFDTDGEAPGILACILALQRPNCVIPMTADEGKKKLTAWMQKVKSSHAACLPERLSEVDQYSTKQ